MWWRWGRVGDSTGTAVTDWDGRAELDGQRSQPEPDTSDQVDGAGADTRRDRNITESPTEAETQTPSAVETSAPPGEAASSDTTDTPSWVWWLLAALVVASAVAIPLLMAASRRRDWRADLAAAEQEVGWFVQVLLPELQQAGSAAGVRGGWGVGEPRVAAVEDRLTELAASARDEAGRARAVALRDAVRRSRDRIRALAESGAVDVSHDLAAISAELSATLGQPTSPGM